MEIPRRGSRPVGLPSIRVQESNPHDRYGTTGRSGSYSSAAEPSSIPMSIPNSREPVPPPLPPPRHLADIASGGNNGPDIAWKWGNTHGSGQGWGGPLSSVAPGSSLYGGSLESSRSSLAEDSIARSRRQSSTATLKSAHRTADPRDNSYYRLDEGYASLSGTSIGSNLSKYQDSVSGRSFQSSVHDQYRSNNAQTYDTLLLQKLGSRRGSDNKTPPRGYSKSAFSSSAKDSSPTTRITLDHRHPAQLKPLPINTSRAHLVESPVARWPDTPLSSANSPGNPYSRNGGSVSYDFKSADSMDYEKSRLSYSRRSGSDSVVGAGDDTSSITSRSRESYDARVSPDNDVDFQMEEAGLKRLHIADYSTRPEAYSPGATIGQKRRASSPPGDDGPSLHTVGSVGDLFRRRESAARASPGPPYHSSHGSNSSTGSTARNSTYAPVMSLSTGSITSLSSFGRLSPGGVSPNTDNSDSPYVTLISLNSSPGGTVSRQASHQRVPSEARPLVTARKLSENTSQAKGSSVPRIQGVFLCECCPKKPKKFDSQESLNAHEQEKQYECAYCRNRFKNKNEAERHQNSLHLRRHSWSCAALAGYEAVFHSSPNRPDADTCGFCGEDFTRSGVSSPSASGPQTSVPTDQDWDVRILHLQEMHKFGECNHAKKFFRADHFRQHLKHSHAGTSGKWTNMLENACMKDEPLPEPIRGPDRVSPGAIRVGIINEEEELL